MIPVYIKCIKIGKSRHRKQNKGVSPGLMKMSWDCGGQRTTLGYDKHH